jgi:hypothetical protein
MYLRNPIQSQTCKDIEYKQVIGANFIILNYKINENPINYADLVSSLKQIICRVCKFGSSYQTLLYSWTKMKYKTEITIVF